MSSAVTGIHLNSGGLQRNRPVANENIPVTFKQVSFIAFKRGDNNKVSARCSPEGLDFLRVHRL